MATEEEAVSVLRETMQPMTFGELAERLSATEPEARSIVSALQAKHLAEIEYDGRCKASLGREF